MLVKFIFACVITIGWMNILHLVTAKKDSSPEIQKLKASCKDTATCPVKYPKDELKERLTPLQYRVTQEKGTERLVFASFLGMLMIKDNNIKDFSKLTLAQMTNFRLSQTERRSR